MTPEIFEEIEKMKKEMLDAWYSYKCEDTDIITANKKINRIKLDCVRRFGLDGLEELATVEQYIKR